MPVPRVSVRKCERKPINPRDGMENCLYLHFIRSKIRSISTMLGRIKSVWMEFVSSSSFDISIILGDLTES